MESAAKRCIDKGDRTVGSVHGPDEPQVRRQLEGLVRPIGGAHLLIPVFEEEQKLAEHLRKVRPVDLVNHEDVPDARRRRRLVSKEPQWAISQLVGERVIGAEPWPVALEEVLVGGRRVELHQEPPRVVGRQHCC